MVALGAVSKDAQNTVGTDEKEQRTRTVRAAAALRDDRQSALWSAALSLRAEAVA